MELNASYKHAVAMLPSNLSRRASDLTSTREGNTWRVCDADGELLAEVKGDTVRLVNSRTGQAASKFATADSVGRAFEAFGAHVGKHLRALSKRIAALEAGATGATAGGRQVRTLSIPMIVEKLAGSSRRIIRGRASTRDQDRHGDIVMPRGATWKLPLPLLHAHDHQQVIGSVRELWTTDDAIHITAELVEGTQRADEIWRLVEAGALDSFSIGFIGKDFDLLPSGGRRWTSFEVIEVSVVAVPSNPSAKITGATTGAGA